MFHVPEQTCFQDEMTLFSSSSFLQREICYMHLKSFYLLSVLFFTVCPGFARERPNLMIDKKEAAQINQAAGKYALFDHSCDRLIKSTDRAVASALIVPPPGEGGGYEHERHKQNYREMYQAGICFTLSGEEKYARFVRDMLLEYASLYPTLGKHPQSRDQAPGKLFHQMLNETLWLTYASIAYDCIYDWLDAASRTRIEKDVFRLIIDWFVTENHEEFDRIHNHGTWTVCSIGLIGYVLDDKNLVEMALYGTQKDGQGGFLKQLDLLFSPDGYYMEGPYYARYALQPFFIFAEAIARNQPELKIYAYREQILKKAYYAAVQTTFPDGVFPPINDASRTMDLRDSGMIMANDLVYGRYGADPNLLAVKKMQRDVIINGAGLMVARDFAAQDKISPLDWGSIEFSDGYDGKQGGLGILRTGAGEKQSMLLMKYGVHGEGHGHFDKLHFIYYDQGRPVIPDYGFCRWINIEPKMGGRYLPENKSYAMQTIAHNTVTVDQTSQNRGNRRQADAMSGQRHFFAAGNPAVQVMSARADAYFPAVAMQRTLFLIKEERLPHPVVVDLYRISSARTHRYDYPVHHQGQLITTNFEYQASSTAQSPLGADFGYQHIWQTASAKVDDAVKITWLDGNRYYTLLSAAAPGSEVLFGRSGANDPNYNLLSEPLFLIRTQAQDHLFASVIESHGHFDEAREQSSGATGRLTGIKVIGHDSAGTVIEVTGEKDLRWLIMVNNGTASATRKHTVTFAGKKYAWEGNYKVELR